MRISINKRFDILQDLTTLVTKRVMPSLVVTGGPGNGKSHTIIQTIQENGLSEGDTYVVFKGYSTARGLYNTLYDHNGKLIIFDDCDSVLEDKTSLNILKSALDSYERRTISWMAKLGKSDEYPNQFDFTGRIIFISNKSKESIDQAILSRSLTVDLSMTFSEKIERMSHILENILPEMPMVIKKESLEFLGELKDNKNLTIRSLITVCKIRNTFSDTWKDMAKYMIGS
jgi:broad-specificity NMP kinase